MKLLIEYLHDEIALEGLEGITLQGLWLRLEKNLDFSKWHKCDSSRKFELWELIKDDEAFTIYKLPEARQDLQIFNRYEHMDEELGVVLEKDLPEARDPYPYCPVFNGKTGEMGSCQFYWKRQDVTQEVLNYDLQQMEDKYPKNTIVIVCSQELREKALLGRVHLGFSELQLTDFCILERIGRTRTMGDVTQGKYGQSQCGDPKKLFYHRKKLLQLGLITKQIHMQKSLNGSSQSGSLLHITRFYVERKSKFIVLIGLVVQLLKNSPNYILPAVDIYALIKLPSTSGRKLMKNPEFLKHIQFVTLPYTEIYPDHPVSESHCKNGKEKQIRCAKLINPSLDIDSICRGDKEYGDEESDCDGILDQSKLNLRKSLLKQAYELVRGSSDVGISINQIGKDMGLNKLDARTICRSLERCCAVVRVFKDLGRQRQAYYVCHMFVNNRNSLIYLKNKLFNSPECKEEEVCKMKNSLKETHIKTELVSTAENSNLYLEGYDNLNISDPNLEVDSCYQSNCPEVNSSHPHIPVEPQNDSPINDPPQPNYEVDHPFTFSSELTQPIISSESISAVDVHPNIESSSPIETKSQEPMEVDHFQELSNLSVHNKLPAENNTDCFQPEETFGPTIELDSNVLIEPQQSLNNNSFEERLISQVTGTETSDFKSVLPINNQEEITADKIPEEPLSNYEDSYANVQCIVKVSEREIDRSASDIRSEVALNRANTVKEFIKEQKVIGDIFRIQNKVLEVEEDQDFKIDKKTIIRLLDRNLIPSGLVKVVTVTFNSPTRGSITHKLYVHPSVMPGDHTLSEVVEQLKMKFCAPKRDLAASTKLPEVRDKKRSEERLVEITPEERFDLEMSLGKLPAPKFGKVQELHTFLFYLAWLHKGDCSLDQSTVWNLFHLDNGVDVTSTSSHPKIYIPELSVRTFLPPLKQLFVKGWVRVSDVISLMPLVLFTRIIKHIITPQIAQFLNDPVKRFYPLRYLPHTIYSVLMKDRTPITHIMSVIHTMCSMGLAQKGPHIGGSVEKDHCYVYMNQNVKILDTTNSAPGYNTTSTDDSFQCRRLCLLTDESLTQYWYQVSNICRSTPLGDNRFKPVATQEKITSKKIPIEETKEFKDGPLCDTGNIPGDGKGAGGFDSSLLAHLPRSWYYRNLRQHQEPRVALPQSELSTTTSAQDGGVAYQNYLMSTTLSPVTPVQKQRGTFKSKNGEVKKFEYDVSIVKKEPNAKRKSSPGKSDNGSKKRIRSGNEVATKTTKKKPKKPNYDADDQIALGYMTKLRVDWSPKEDSLLLICKVAALYLLPSSSRPRMLPFSIVRKILKKRLPESRNKTSLACRRRVSNIMKIPETEKNVAIFLEIAKSDGLVKKKFVPPSVPLNEENLETVYAPMFVDLVCYLAKKFARNASIQTLDIPSDYDTFHSNYKIEPLYSKFDAFLKRPLTTTNIQFFVIQTLIYSSLCCRYDKESYAYQLYHVYKNYSHQMLYNSLLALKDNQMLSVKKSYSRASKVFSCLPLSASPFQLSNSYVHKFVTRHQYSLYSSCWNLIKTLTNNYHECYSSGVDNYLPIMRGCSGGGSVAALIEQTSVKRLVMRTILPDTIIGIDSEFALTNRYSELSPTKEIESASIEAHSPLEKEFNVRAPYSEEQEENVNSRKKLEFLSDMDAASTSALADDNVDDDLDDNSDRDELQKSLGPLDLSNQFQSQSDPNFLIDKMAAGFMGNNDSLIEDDLSNQELLNSEFLAPQTPTNNHKGLRPVSSASRLSVFLKDKSAMNRIDSEDVKSSSPCLLQHMQDNLQLTACDVTCKMWMPPEFIFPNKSLSKEEMRDYLLPNARATRSSLLEECSRRVVDTNLTLDDLIIDWRKLGYSEQIISLVQEIYAFIDSKQSVGATLADIKTWRCEKGGCMAVVREMESFGLILKEGVGEPTWISLRHSHPWLIHSKKIKREDRQALKLQGIYHMDIKPPENSDTDQDSESKGVKRKLSEEQEGDLETETEMIKVEDIVASKRRKNNSDACSSTELPTTGLLRSRFSVKKLNYTKDKEVNQECERKAFHSSVERQDLTISLRPWIRIQGTVNRRVLDRMLGTILFIIMESPGISGSAIAEKLCPAIQPVHVYELLSMLFDWGCLRRVRDISLKMNPMTLFDGDECCDASHLLIDDSTPEDSDCDVIFSPTVDAVSRLSAFIGDKKYSQDFLCEELR